MGLDSEASVPEVGQTCQCKICSKVTEDTVDRFFSGTGGQMCILKYHY